MVVRIDQPRQHGECGQIDDFGACRNDDVGANCGEFPVLDENHLVGGDCAHLGIDEAASLDRRHLCDGDCADEEL